MNEKKVDLLLAASENLLTQKRFLTDRLDRNNISQEEYEKFLGQSIEGYQKRLADILLETKTENKLEHKFSVDIGY